MAARNQMMALQMAAMKTLPKIAALVGPKI